MIGIAVGAFWAGFFLGVLVMALMQVAGRDKEGW